MNNKRKALTITAVILLLTLGVATVNIFLFPAEGFYYIGPGMLLLLPALPFIWMISSSGDNLGLSTAAMFITSSIFWLSIAYFIGAYLDRKQNK